MEYPDMGLTNDPLGLINIYPLMDTTLGDPQIVIGLIDGPVDLNHSAFQDSRILAINESYRVKCKSADSTACMHGTFIAGILCAKRDSPAPAICPGCKVVLRPIFMENVLEDHTTMPSSTPEELSNAIIETVDSGARIINLSIGLLSHSLTRYNMLDEAYSYARNHNVIVVVAAGNQGNIGFNSLLDNGWVIPVAGCDEIGKLNASSNFGPSIGKYGLMAPSTRIRSTVPGGKYGEMSGTSLSAAFVTGSIALLWSEFSNATAAEIKYSITRERFTTKRHTIVPEILSVAPGRKYLKDTLPPQRIRVA